MKIVLTIAGSDSSGGAGMQADIKTMQTLNIFASCVLTCSTAQNTKGISELINLPPNHIKNQLDKVLSDYPIDTIKIGVLGDSLNYEIIANAIKKYKIKNIILDPVMACKNTTVFLKNDQIDLLIKTLFSIATLITPNLAEACILAKVDYKTIKSKQDIINLYEKIKVLGCDNVLIKAGHLDNNPIDILFYNGKKYEFEKPKINTKNTHGTGCTLSSAIASYLTLGNDMIKSVELAKNYVYDSIKKGAGFKTKFDGPGPIGHHYN